MHCLTPWGQWAVELLQCIATPPGCSRVWNSYNAVPHCLGGGGSAVLCNTLPHCLGALGGGTPTTRCQTAGGQGALKLLSYIAILCRGRGRWNSFTASGQLVVLPLQYTTSLPGGSGQWKSCNELPYCLGAVDSVTPAMHYQFVRGAVQHVSCSATVLGGSEQLNSSPALPYSLGAGGGGTRAMQCLASWGQWAVQLLQYNAFLPWGNGEWNACNALPHCLGEAGGATSAVQRHTAWGPWPLELLECIA